MINYTTLITGKTNLDPMEFIKTLKEKLQELDCKIATSFSEETPVESPEIMLYKATKKEE